LPIELYTGKPKDAAEIAINSPLLDVSISGAKGVLLAVSGSDDLGILEVQEAAKAITEAVDSDAKIIFGIMKDEKLKKGHIRVIVIATGFPEKAGMVAPERGTSLFSLPRKEQEDERDRIYNTVIPKSKVEEEREEAPSEPEVKEEEEEEEDDDHKDTMGGAIPSFLRRHK